MSFQHKLNLDIDTRRVSSSIKNVKRLAIVTTDKCQARCAHCLMKSGPQRSERLTVSTVKETITFFAEHSQLLLVAFTGGESTLLGDDLLEMIAYCTELGIASRLVTNAIWASSDRQAQSMIRDLRSVGLTEINFSTDDFHAVWVPLANIKRAWKASKGAGFSSVLIATCSGYKSRITPEYMVEVLAGNPTIVDDIDLLNQLPRPEIDGTRYMVSRSSIGRLGRGTHLREDLLPPFTNSTIKNLYGGCPGIFDPATLNADGSLGVCCGINTEYNRILSLGKMSTLCQRDSYETDYIQDTILNAIRTIGPAFLLHIATEDPNIITDMRFRNVCEICEFLTSNENLMLALKNHLKEIKYLTHLSTRYERTING